MKGVLSWLVHWACRAEPRDFVLPELEHALVGAPYKIFFSSPYTISIPLSASPNNLGRQPCWVACLVVSVSGYTDPSGHMFEYMH
jgi:hypothetical protein